MGGPKARGQALAEFALALPVFLLIMLALFDVGRVVFVYNGLTNAAREGARLADRQPDKDMVLERAQTMAFGTAITTTSNDAVQFYRSQPTPMTSCQIGNAPISPWAASLSLWSTQR